MGQRKFRLAGDHGFVMLQCVAVCCSVLQCVAVCCTVMQCVAVCCSVLQCFPGIVVGQRNFSLAGDHGFVMLQRVAL